MNRRQALAILELMADCYLLANQQPDDAPSPPPDAPIAEQSSVIPTHRPNEKENSRGRQPDVHHHS